MHSAHKIIIARSPEEYATSGKNIIKSIVSVSSPCHIALAGGTSPIPIYETLHTIDTQWSHVHFWWSDERYVPLNHPESNYHQAIPYLQQLSLPSTQIHPINTSLGLSTAAQQYGKEISQILNHQPKLDLIILGIGPDGHTASLFPNTPSGQNQSPELVIPIFDSPKPPSQRITFTFNLINQAKNILICVKGKERINMITAWLNGTPSNLPFTHINPTNGIAHWLMMN